MSARELGARVLLLERAPRHLRGGNSRHTRNVRTAHDGADDYVTGPYSPTELRADIRALNADGGNDEMIDLLVAESMTLPPWMSARGVRWQGPLRGTLHLSRTNRFFLGGGKTLVNAYYRTAEAAGVDVRYETPVVGLDMRDGQCRAVVVSEAGRETTLECDALVVAAGGFEANLAWLGEYWGAAAANFIVRGTRYNDGSMLRLLLDHGADSIADPRGFHAVAVDARSPKYDGGIVTRLDAVPVGIVVNRDADRFYDEGEDIWPKRYAQWGGLIARQPGQIAYSIFDAKRRHAIMPPVFPPIEAGTVEELAERIDLDPTRLASTVREFNAHIPDGQKSSLAALDGATTVGLTPAKTNWAVRIDAPPFLAFPLRPGITFTYYGVRVDREARVQTREATFDNVYAAGEIMAGNVMTRGYIAGIGMTVGSVFGRIAGRAAAAHA